MKIPQQAAILCGGLGTRLRPITKKIPKPMVMINNRPFLFFLLEQLATQGITKFLLMTGYLGEQIHEYFGSGNNWGWEIEYSHGPTEWDTGKRLWEARLLLEDNFLLLYSDDFTTFNLVKLWDYHRKKQMPLTLMLAEKRPGNIRIDQFGDIESYDQSRLEPELNYVEIGYMVVNRDTVFSFFDSPNVSLTVILHKMALQKKLAGYVQGDGYHSISDPQRLRKMERYLGNKNTLIIDRDGVINKRLPQGEYVSTWEDFKWILETKQALKLLSKEGFRFVIISNQAGVARGMIDNNDLELITQNMTDELGYESIEILQTYICKHHWDDNCACRKPKPELFYQASRDWLFRLDKAIFVGDDSRDCQAAFNAGCASIFLGHKHELKDLKREELPIGIHPNFLEALPDIFEYYQH